MFVIPLVLAIGLAWYLPLLICRSKTPTASKKRYAVLTMLFVFIIGIPVALILNTMGDKLLSDVIGIKKDTPLYMFLDAMCIVAVEEEAVKFLCGYMFIKLAKPTEKVDYILIMGASSIGFALAEDITYALSGGVAMCFVRGVFPLHLIREASRDF